MNNFYFVIILMHYGLEIPLIMYCRLSLVDIKSKDSDLLNIKGRWVIERTFARFDNDRRLCRNYETSFNAAENMVRMAAIKLSSIKFKQAFSSL